MNKTSIEFTNEEIEALQDCIEYKRKLEHRYGGDETIFNSINEKLKKKIAELNLVPSSLKQGISISGKGEIRVNEDGLKYLTIYGLGPIFMLSSSILFKEEKQREEEDYKFLKKWVGDNYLPVSQAPLNTKIDILIYTQGIKLNDGNIKAKLPVYTEGNKWVEINNAAQTYLKINFYSRNDVID